MPAFQSLTGSSSKRKLDADDSCSRKRPAPPRPASPDSSKERVWVVQWRHPQARKHKTWDGDAVMTEHGPGTQCKLYDMDGKLLCFGKPDTLQIKVGTNLKVAGRELEVDRSVPREEYLSGRCFGNMIIDDTPEEAAPNVPGPSRKKFVVPQMTRPAPAPAPLPSRAVSINTRKPPSPARKENATMKLATKHAHFTANWRKTQTKKNKTWDGDAFVSLVGDKLTMYTEEGKVMGAMPWTGPPLYSELTMFIGGKEVQLVDEVSKDDLPDMPGIFKDDDHEIKIETSPVKPALPVAAQAKPFVAPTSFYGAPPKPKAKGPLHDPDAPDAIVFKAPTKEHAKKYNPKNYPIVPVVMDPILARHMRPHQIEGVKFMYESVMGMRKHEGQGCILADEMGLGKTLQTVALIWTLLKQSPYVNGTKPAVGRVLVVCPVSLVKNWRMEFHKWLGKDRVGVFDGDKEKAQVKQFINSRIHQVLVIGYERLRKVIEELRYCDPPIDLIVCDEGHRLKSANNKTSAMFKVLRTTRRIILSGTPIQNALSEFHAMADFCNPGLLDDYSTFRRNYELPILKSRAPDCTSKELELGEGRSVQLHKISKSFVLRRDATILKNFLPPKHEYVVFITPSATQIDMFKAILNADKIDSILSASTADALALINTLTKISNSPMLFKQSMANGKMKRPGMEEALKIIPAGSKLEDVKLSGKLSALANLLRAIKQDTEEKVILVSHYTSTLDILELFCKKKKYNFFRLDGKTPPAKRQEYVNAFNQASQQSKFIFLLSSKAGGVGLNLIGASRLVLIDSDWNPSHDLQAMARIHRDGQKRPVYIYRFLTAGTIDEKIFQRQVTKLGLSDSLIGTGGAKGSKSDSFSHKDLRDIFKIHPNTTCNTHELLGCDCDGSGDRDDIFGDNSNDGFGDDVLEDVDDSDVEMEDGDDDDDAKPSKKKKGFTKASDVKAKDINKVDKAYMKRQKAALASLGDWKHINCLTANAAEDCRDDILRQLIYSRPPPETTKAVSTSTSRLGALLDVNLDAVTAAAEEDEELAPLSVRDIPGGSVSFLFERGAKIDPERGESEEGQEGGEIGEEEVGLGDESEVEFVEDGGKSGEEEDE